VVVALPDDVRALTWQLLVGAGLREAILSAGAVLTSLALALGYIRRMEIPLEAAQ
jgi:hypothetical protein